MVKLSPTPAKTQETKTKSTTHTPGSAPALLDALENLIPHFSARSNLTGLDYCLDCNRYAPGHTADCDVAAALAVIAQARGEQR